ncbi:unnamed protein product [Arabidopsis thaliana]|uniref:CCT motif family protein n=2 Tax=Arabidopsis thaliana TaxID=3702 RepID=Q1PFY7_ARATH|nr:CCT motif family protein [Arabidopsis thaliana]NP_171944.2 CCT motif family protein [Arabidopsis thaliana]ABE65597.1 zinc finger CONSTANS-like protein [Arabidopsis thaliana]AEE27705.1 CCT motif family protein [Arabidopsis thaliana]ANM59918.1 CCT motif family protein [Arabidopsis thaliana]CAA0164388.1 unnamed protein product [Arabidopsis thaliana]VYS44987.1 unnamed protein product [Arabidopsis thaliana]|eukprot:NP_001318920.1 CCT motif family protein [Arabidopsis thaliana]
MSQDVISSHEQLSMDEITSPLTAQIFDFCDSQLFQETFNQTSEVTSASNGCGYVENNNTNNFPDKSNSGSNQDHEDNNDNADLSIIFDSQDDFDNDITASIDFSSSIQFPASDQLQEQFDFTGIQLHQPPNTLYSSSSGDLLPPPLSVFEEDCLSSVPSYNLGSINPSSPSCSFLGNTGLPTYMTVTGNMMNTGLGSGFYSGNIHLGSDFKPSHDQLMEIQADNGGLFCPDPIKPIFNPGDHHLQGLDGVENQNHMVAQPVLPQLGTEITGLDDPSFNKVGKLSAEQRKEKIHRYMKKRNERNFSKKIKYACRKTLADSRPRVRGRFAKNDEFGEPNRQACSSHHEDDDDDVGVKEEEQLVDSSDIFSHISGVNSFKCNYPIQSWI